MVSLPPAKSSIDEQRQSCFRRGMSGDTRDFVGETFVLVKVVLSEDGVRVIFLESVDRWDNFFALFAVFVS